MSREFCIAFLVSLAAHASLVGICNPLHDRNEGEKGEEQNLMLLGIVELSAPAAPEVPPEPPPAQAPEEPIPAKPEPPPPVVEPLPPAADEQLALIAPEPEETPVSLEEPTEAPVPDPPEQGEDLPAEVPMVEHYDKAGQPQLTGGQIEDLRSRYLRAVLERLEEAKRYPRLAYRRNIEGSATISFMIFPDGTAGGVSVRKSSRHEGLDNAAKDMVARAAPFDPLPIELGLQELRIVVPVAFQIDGVYQR